MYIIIQRSPIPTATISTYRDPQLDGSAPGVGKPVMQSLPCYAGLSICEWGCTCHGTHVEVRGQLSSWSSPSNLFETGLVGQVSWHTYFWGLSLPYLRTALYRQALWSSVFTWILGIPGPHTCTGSTSPSEPSPPFSIIDLLPPVENLFLGLSSGDGSIFFPVSVTS